MKGKKLPPDVWIVFNRLGEIPDIQTDKAKAKVLFPKSESLHRYTPAKPAKAKKCKCAGRCISGPWKFCPYCGGKIKVKR